MLRKSDVKGAEKLFFSMQSLQLLPLFVNTRYDY